MVGVGVGGGCGEARGGDVFSGRVARAASENQGAEEVG